MDNLQFNQSQEEFLKTIYGKICQSTPSREKIDSCSLDIVEKNPVFQYIPQPIQKWIQSTHATCKKIQLQIQEREISIYIIDFSRYSEKKYQKIIHLIKQWINIVSQYASKTCAQNLSIYLYLTPFKKNISQKGNALDVLQINTASTTSCMKDNTILIFRQEEWFKVFIHETFHCMGLDFSDQNTDNVDGKILGLYAGCDPSLDVRFYETYCEIWATLSNILFMMCYRDKYRKTRDRKQHGTRKSTRMLREKWNMRIFINSLNEERKYSMYQAAKVLDHYGITYRQLIGVDEIQEKYREKTQIFAYYILKSNIFFFMGGFWKWVEQTARFSLDFPKTQSEKSIDEFFQLIETHYNNPVFIRELDQIQLNKDSKKYKSMKMTVYGDFFAKD